MQQRVDTRSSLSKLECQRPAQLPLKDWIENLLALPNTTYKVNSEAKALLVAISDLATERGLSDKSIFRAQHLTLLNIIDDMLDRPGEHHQPELIVDWLDSLSTHEPSHNFSGPDIEQVRGKLNGNCTLDFLIYMWLAECDSDGILPGISAESTAVGNIKKLAELVNPDLPLEDKEKKSDLVQCVRKAVGLGKDRVDLLPLAILINAGEFSSNLKIGLADLYGPVETIDGANTLAFSWAQTPPADVEAFCTVSLGCGAGYSTTKVGPKAIQHLIESFSKVDSTPDLADIRARITLCVQAYSKAAEILQGTRGDLSSLYYRASAAFQQALERINEIDPATPLSLDWPHTFLAKEISVLYELDCTH